MDKALFKDHYLFELDRREKLTQEMNAVVTGLTVVGGLIGFALQNYSLSLSGPGKILVTVSALFGGIAYAAALYSAMKCYHFPQTYMAVATSSQLWHYYNELMDFSPGDPDAKSKADEAFETYMNRVYAQATDLNANINFYRGDRKGKALKWLTYAVAWISGGFLIGYFDSLT